MTSADSKYQRITLYIGLSIPFCMMLLVAGAIYLPRWLVAVEPATVDFVYLIGQRDPYFQYRIKNHRLVRKQLPLPDQHTHTLGDLQFFVHEVSSNSSREISFEQASQFALDPTDIAPDGYRIAYGRRAGWFPFDSHT